MSAKFWTWNSKTFSSFPRLVVDFFYYFLVSVLLKTEIFEIYGLFHPFSTICCSHKSFPDFSSTFHDFSTTSPGISEFPDFSLSSLTWQTLCNRWMKISFHLRFLFLIKGYEAVKLSCWKKRGILNGYSLERRMRALMKIIRIVNLWSFIEKGVKHIENISMFYPFKQYPTETTIF